MVVPCVFKKKKRRCSTPALPPPPPRLPERLGVLPGCGQLQGHRCPRGIDNARVRLSRRRQLVGSCEVESEGAGLDPRAAARESAHRASRAWTRRGTRRAHASPEVTESGADRHPLVAWVLSPLSTIELVLAWFVWERFEKAGAWRGASG